MSKDNSGRYAGRGVSSQKKEVHAAIQNLDKGAVPGAFCKLLPHPQDASMVQALHADGAGTKSSLAYAYWKTSGDLSVWKGIAQDALVMNLDDMMCAGCLTGFVVSSTIGRNKHLIPAEVISALIQGNQEFMEMLGQYGIHCQNAGGETADVGDLVRTIIVDSTVFAQWPKADVVDNHDIAPGQWIVGLASYGQANYEPSYNSGMGSNGLTSARHDLFSKQVEQHFPETRDPNTPDELTYTGPFNLQDAAPQEGMDMGRFVLSPTRTYLPIVKTLMEDKAIRTSIKGMVHCTGGGQSKVLHFLPKGCRVIKDNLLPIPPLFELIKKHSGADWKEMYQVFNMGHRLELYLDSKEMAEECVAAIKTFGIDGQLIGRVEAHPDREKSDVQLQKDGNPIVYA